MFLGRSITTGPGRPGRRHVEGLVDHAGEVTRLLHEIVVLRAGPGDADRVRLLEGVVADHVRRHLPGGQTIGTESMSASVRPVTVLVAPGPESDEHHAHLAGAARITFGFGGMDRGLLVTDEDVPQLVLRNSAS